MSLESTIPVTVYWRPGCSYCARLRRDLRRMGLVTTEVNIWEDSAAATRLRAIADGNETVPTVVVGDRALVNPPVAAVVEAVRADARTRRHGEPLHRGIGENAGVTVSSAHLTELSSHLGARRRQ